MYVAAEFGRILLTEDGDIFLDKNFQEKIGQVFYVRYGEKKIKLNMEVSTDILHDLAECADAF